MLFAGVCLSSAKMAQHSTSNKPRDSVSHTKDLGYILLRSSQTSHFSTLMLGRISLAKKSEVNELFRETHRPIFTCDGLKNGSSQGTVSFGGYKS